MFDLNEIWHTSSGGILQLHAKFQFAATPLSGDFEIGSRVGRSFRESCAFWLDHFFPR